MCFHIALAIRNMEHLYSLLSQIQFLLDCTHFVNVSAQPMQQFFCRPGNVKDCQFGVSPVNYSDSDVETRLNSNVSTF